MRTIPTVAVLHAQVNREWIIIDGQAQTNRGRGQRLGEGWGTQERVCVLSLQVRCPFCGRLHFHGANSDQDQPGHRIADCWDPAGGYHIVWREGQEAV